MSQSKVKGLTTLLIIVVVIGLLFFYDKESRVQKNDSLVGDVSLQNIDNTDEAHAIDINSLEKITGFYFKDKDNVYYDKSHGSNKFTIVEDADPNTFEKIDKRAQYFRDKNYVFCDSYDQSSSYFSKRIDGVDADSFRNIEIDTSSLESDYYTDGKHIIYRCNIMNQFDTETFEYLGFTYSKDKNNIYYNNDVLSGSDLESFTVKKIGEDWFFAYDKNHVYRYSEIIPDSDPSTLDFSGFLPRDKNNLYYVIGRAIGEADFATNYVKVNGPITHLGGSYFKDLEKVCNRGGYTYFCTDEVDVDTARLINGYLVDKNSVYNPDDKPGLYLKRKIEGLEPNPDNFTFSEEKSYLFDSDSVFYYEEYFRPNGDFSGVIIPVVDADRETFVEINKYIGKDKNNIYVQEEKIDYLDPVSFKVLQDTERGLSVSDKNGAYMIKVGVHVTFEGGRVTSIEKL